MTPKKTLVAAALALLSFATLGAQQPAANHRKRVKQAKTEKTQKTMATVHLTTSEFKKKVFDYEANPREFKYEGKLPAIVDFYATWCGPCKALAPVLEDLAKEYDGKVVIYKVDVDEAQEVAALFGIRSIPTLLFIPADGGKPRMQAGAPTRSQLKAIIDDIIK